MTEQIWYQFSKRLINKDKDKDKSYVKFHNMYPVLTFVIQPLFLRYIRALERKY